MNHRRIHLVRLAVLCAIVVGCRSDVGDPGESRDVVEDKSLPTTTYVPNPLFSDESQSSGIDFRNDPGDSFEYRFPQIMGSGCALLDFDRDDRLDVLLLSGESSVSTVRLYRQIRPWVFQDVTSSVGLMASEFAMGAAVGDVNNDGYVDVYVTFVGEDRLFLNRNGMQFDDISDEAGIRNSRWGASACMLDFDRDGRLDIYVTNYVDLTPIRCEDRQGGGEDFCGPQVFSGTSDRLFRNVTDNPADGETTVVRFADVSIEQGIIREIGPGLGVIPVDPNRDGWPDVYVANDQTPNVLWINREGQGFVNEASLWGLATDELGRSQAGMGVVAADFNGDLFDDLAVTHLNGEANAIYLAIEDRGFLESSRRTRMYEASYAMTGFGLAAFDIQHDGLVDIVQVNGLVKRPPGRSAERSDMFWQQYAQPNQIFLGDGDGTFSAVAADSQPFLAADGVSRGLATGDIDGDGDLDLLVTDIAGPPRLYRNNCDPSAHWLKVSCRLPSRGNRDAEGSRVTVRSGTNTFVRTVTTAGSYLSAVEPVAHFGLGDVGKYDSIDVRWPDGSQETFDGGPADRHLFLEQGRGVSEQRAD